VSHENGAESREKESGGAMVNTLTADPYTPAIQVDPN
jgi:hypothetical protein